MKTDGLTSLAGPSCGDYMVNDCKGEELFFTGLSAQKDAYEYANTCGKYVQIYRYVGWCMVTAIHPEKCNCEQCESTRKYKAKKKRKRRLAELAVLAREMRP